MFALDRTLYVADKWKDDRFHVAAEPVGLFGVLFEHIEEKRNNVFTIADCGSPFFRVLKDEIGWVESARQLGDLHIETALQRRACGLPRRLDPRLIGIEREHQIVGNALY